MEVVMRNDGTFLLCWGLAAGFFSALALVSYGFFVVEGGGRLLLVLHP
jgi:hypothetical protein